MELTEYGWVPKPFGWEDRVHGHKVLADGVDLDDGTSIINVKLYRRNWKRLGRWELVDHQRFEDIEAHEAAASWIASLYEFLDPNRPSLEERLAPFGLEWEREQAERYDLPF